MYACMYVSPCAEHGCRMDLVDEYCTRVTVAEHARRVGSIVPVLPVESASVERQYLQNLKDIIESRLELVSNYPDCLHDLSYSICVFKR